MSMPCTWPSTSRRRSLSVALRVVLKEVRNCRSEEATRSATGVEYGLITVLWEQFGNDTLAQPVGRVVFAEVVAVFGVNQLLVDTLEYVLPNLGQVVFGQVRSE